MKISVGKNNSVEDALLTVYVVDHEDNYHRLEDENTAELNEFEKRARKIRRKHKYYADYIQDLDVYNNYMKEYIDTHFYGNVELFNIFYRDGNILDFIPHRPRLKKTASNKKLLKSGGFLSRIKISEEQMDHFVKNYIKEHNDEVYNPHIKMDKKKDLKKIMEKSVLPAQIQRIEKKRIDSMNEIDYLNEYFMNREDRHKKLKPAKRMSLTECLNSEFYEEDPDEYAVRNVNGHFVSSNVAKELEVYEVMRSLGYDHLKLMKRLNVSKKFIDMEKKKVRGNKKKDKKKKKKQEKVDDFLVSMATDNNYDSFEDFEKEMLDFTSKRLH